MIIDRADGIIIHADDEDCPCVIDSENNGIPLWVAIYAIPTDQLKEIIKTESTHKFILQDGTITMRHR